MGKPDIKKEAAPDPLPERSKEAASPSGYVTREEMEAQLQALQDIMQEQIDQLMEMVNNGY